MNFMLKVEDAKMTQVKKALEKENIKVVSIYEVYKEKPASGTTADRRDQSRRDRLRMRAEQACEAWMKIDDLAHELEEVARKLSVRVSYEDLRWRGPAEGRIVPGSRRARIIINKALNKEDRAHSSPGAWQVSVGGDIGSPGSASSSTTAGGRDSSSEFGVRS
jgi:hypothetical protein